MSKRLSGSTARAAISNLRALSIDEFERLTFDEFIGCAFAGWKRVAKTKADPTHPRFLFSRPGADGGTQWALYAPSVNSRHNGREALTAWENLSIGVKLNLLTYSLDYPNVIVGKSEVELYDLLPEKRRMAATRPEEIAACTDWVLSKMRGETGAAVRTLHALLT